MPLSDYNRIKQVGSGGFAAAYLVELKTDRTKKFVMKEMQFSGASERKDCEAEVELLRQLSHQHIVTFHESFSTRKIIYIVMEYCSRGDLAQYLKDQKNYLRETHIIAWTLQILQALRYLHGRLRPVLHRDMKPANIFLTERSWIKIGDFGISKELAHVFDMTQTMCGTPLYLAPEIYRQEAYDNKCDIWSLGCCVYEMMALKPAISPLLLATLNIVSINPMPTNYSKGLVDIVVQMLSINPSARPSAAHSFDQVKALFHIRPRQDSPTPGSSSAAASLPTPPSSPSPPSSPPSSPLSFPAAVIASDMPVDSLILIRDQQQRRKDNGTADNTPDDLVDDYDCIDIDEFEDTLKEVDAIPIKTPAWCLREYGYRFNDRGRLIDINTGEGFMYDALPKKADNEKRYREIAMAVTEYVYELLEKELNMQRIYLPLDCERGEPWTFIYVTPNIFSNTEKLLILIGGAGPIRAGIWSRKAVINDNIDAGSQMPLIREATRNGYAVLLLNQNQTFLEVDGFKVKIRGNQTELEHTLYVWDKVIINNTKVKHVAIMTHSEGAEIAAKLAIERKDSFMKLVFGVALCHPRKEDLLQGAPKEVVDLFATNSKTWVASKKPLDTLMKKSALQTFFVKEKQEQYSAGDERPEWTASTSMNPAFEFIQKQFEKRSAE